MKMRKKEDENEERENENVQIRQNFMKAMQDYVDKVHSWDVIRGCRNLKSNAAHDKNTKKIDEMQSKHDPTATCNIWKTWSSRATKQAQ